MCNNKQMKWDQQHNCQGPEIYIHLNDLPSNDFNSLFKDMAKLQLQNQPLCLVMGVPGSFYGWLFPRNSLHFVHSNYALHWLSQVPPGLYNEQGRSINKGSINLHKASPPGVVKAYLDQFEQDWTKFLNYRSQEVVPNGYVLLVVRGRHPKEKSKWELKLLAQALASLVSKGLIEEEKWESFEFPCHCPSKEEIEEVVQREGSFEIDHIAMILDDAFAQEFQDNQARAKALAKCVWGFSSTVVSHHFGQEVLNTLYNELLQVTLKHLIEGQSLDPLSIMVLLRKGAPHKVY